MELPRFTTKEEMDCVDNLQRIAKLRKINNIAACLVITKTNVFENLEIGVVINSDEKLTEYKITATEGNILILDCFEILEIKNVCICLYHNNKLINYYGEEINNRENTKISGCIENQEFGFVNFDFWSLNVNNYASEKLSENLIIGHRGCGESKYETTVFPENTVKSFNEAINIGLKAIEFDVHLTSDMIPVIHHDFVKTRDSMSYVISEITSGDFLSISDNNNHQFQDKPCTLEHMLDNTSKNVWLSVEIKYPDSIEVMENNIKNIASIERYVKTIVELLIKKDRKKIILSSFHPYLILIAKIMYPNLNIFLLTTGRYSEADFINKGTIYGGLCFCARLGLNGIVADFDNVKENIGSMIREFSSFGFNTMFYGSELRDINNIIGLIGMNPQGIVIDDMNFILQINSKSSG